MNDLSFLVRYKELRRKFYPEHTVNILNKPQEDALLEEYSEPEYKPTVRDILMVSTQQLLAEKIEELPPQPVKIEPTEAADDMDFTRTPVWIARKMLEEVAEQTGFTKHEIIGPQRNVDLVAARHYLMWRLRRETTWSLPEIGRFLGGRDHTTVLHGVRKWDQRLKEAENALS